MLKNKGAFLKLILVHNIAVFDVIVLYCLFAFYGRGKVPTAVLQYACIFYGTEGVLGAGIKIFKVLTEKTKKTKKESEETI